jgi:hypothetical protein
VLTREPATLKHFWGPSRFTRRPITPARFAAQPQAVRLKIAQTASPAADSACRMHVKGLWRDLSSHDGWLNANGRMTTSCGVMRVYY